MPKEFSRTRRVAELLRRELAGAIANHLDDPRVRRLSITAVDVSKDLRHAKVFVTFLGEDAQRDEAIAALQRASGRLRHELGRSLNLKVMPKLKIEYDSSVERGAELTRLIDAAVARDRRQ